jgi:hypothetical protein
VLERSLRKVLAFGDLLGLGEPFDDQAPHVTLAQLDRQPHAYRAPADDHHLGV